ncbi:MAG TPA: 2TM domain-containing protein [Chitinophagaceae bacterium]|nr:2TM domain-containing protein [Chitinophagaceae bacterium]
MENLTNNKNPELWEQAKKRADFKSHFFTYLAMVPFFWIVWLLTGADNSNGGFPWPVWPTAGWGIGVLFHYLGVYVFEKYNLVEREYEKLERERKS